MHAQQPKVLHKAIKPSNFLFSASGDFFKIKVSDFGLLDFSFSETGQMSLHNMIYTSPEILLEKKEHTEKCDVYSFGICLWEIITATKPFSEFKEEKSFLQSLSNNHRPAIPKNIPNNLRVLLESCWSANTCLRPSFSEIDSSLLITSRFCFLFSNSFFTFDRFDKDCN